MKDTHISTGFTKLDSLLGGGLHRSELTLLTSSITAMGKTSFATSIVRFIVRETEYSTAIFTLEGNVKGVMMKLVSMESGVDGWNIQQGTTSEDEHSKVQFTIRRFERDRLWLSDTVKKSVEEIRTQLEGKEIDLIVVDYLELMRNTDSQYLQVLADLKQLAKDWNVAILAVFQIHSLAQEHISLSKDVDTLLILHREEKSETALLTVMGAGSHDIGQAHLYFHAPTTRFFNSWEEYKVTYHGSVDD